MYVVLETGGKQYPVKEGDTITVEKVPAEVGQEIVLDKILFASKDEGGVLVGDPYLNGKIVCEVVEQSRHKKVVVFKFKRRKDYKKKNRDIVSITQKLR